VGAVLVVIMALAGAGVANAAWFGMDPLGTGRYNHTATVLKDGRVLVAGGADSAPLASAKLYDPTTNTWSDAGTMHVARHGQAAALLDDGKVLVAGGFTAGTDPTAPGAYTRTAEIYDPAANTWAQVASMDTGRFEPTMTVLKDGRVLVAGGTGDAGGKSAVSLASAEIYNPTGDTWTPATPMSAARAGDTATLLSDGDVLVAGGYDNATGELPSAELYHPSTDTWTPTGPLTDARDAATATALPNGDVLVAGGDGGSGAAIASAEVYSAGTWHKVASMAAARQSAAAALLEDGTVLVAGGESGRTGTPLASTERYDPVSETWTDGGAMSIARARHTLTALPDGRALAIGGSLGGFAAGTTSVERFSPMTANLTPLAFGSLPVGTASDVKTSTLTNTGQLPLAVGAVTVAGAPAKDYAIVSDTCHDSTVAPGGTCTIDVRFTPSAEGSRTATLTVADNTAVGTTTATLAGSGPAPAAPADSGSAPAAAPAAPAAPATPAAPAAGNGGSTAAPQPGIAVGGEQAQHRAAARATCKVSTARSRGRSRSTVTCVVAWPTTDEVALRGRLLQGKRVMASAQATARNGRAVLRLRAAGSLRAGRYTVAITRSNGTSVLRQTVRAS
jgi:Abnormal spindle-like microcephaly-assoc'd, ASPM-SPD-2-Hydin/Kelch motif/Galactose oxidase, central domain